MTSTHVEARLASVSPMVIADRLITLAQEADRAGYRTAASSLVTLMYSVLDEPHSTRLS